MYSQDSKILFVDNQPMFSEALVMVVERIYSTKWCRSVKTIHESIEATIIDKPDLIITDINIGEGSAFELIAFLKENCIKSKIIILTNRDDNWAISRALKYGVKAFLNKSSSLSDFLENLSKVLQGESIITLQMKEAFEEYNQMNSFFNNEMLSKREQEVLKLIGDSKTSKEIANDLNLSFHTINIYRKKLLMKFGVSNSSALVKMAAEYGMI